MLSTSVFSQKSEVQKSGQAPVLGEPRGKATGPLFREGVLSAESLEIQPKPSQPGVPRAGVLRPDMMGTGASQTSCSPAGCALTMTSSIEEDILTDRAEIQTPILSLAFEALSQAFPL